jgi:hypothetical protein
MIRVCSGNVCYYSVPKLTLLCNFKNMKLCVYVHINMFAYVCICVKTMQSFCMLLTQTAENELQISKIHKPIKLFQQRYEGRNSHYHILIYIVHRWPFTSVTK